MDESEFLAAYDPRAYPAVAVTVDVVALTIRDGALHVLLVQRGEPPYAGLWALPGGFVRARTRTCRQAAAAGSWPRRPGSAASALRRVHLEQLATYGAPDRDPRMRVVSIAYLAFAPDLPEPGGRELATRRTRAWPAGRPRCRQPAAGLRPRAGSSPTGWSGPAPSWSTPRWRPRSRGESSPSPSCAPSTRRSGASRCTPATSTARSCRCPGSWRAPATTTERGGPRGGPRARLYRAGDARLLHPALLRPAREEEVR